MSDPTTIEPQTFPDQDPPPYTKTLLIAAGLFWLDAYIGGQGFSFIFFLIFFAPVLLIRALMVRRNRPLRNRRLASIPIYLAATFAALLVVQSDRRGARERAGRVIAAVDSYRESRGRYPETLQALIPDFLPKLPTARQRGLGPRDFRYFTGGPSELTRGTNVHVLVYTTIPPIGKTFYIFEEKRWGFYD